MPTVNDEEFVEQIRKAYSNRYKSVTIGICFTLVGTLLSLLMCIITLHEYYAISKGLNEGNYPFWLGVALGACVGAMTGLALVVAVRGLVSLVFGIKRSERMQRLLLEYHDGL